MLRENIGRADARARRTFAVLLGLMLAFLLADSGSLEEADFVGLRLKSLGQFVRWIPPLLAYFIVDLASAMNLRTLYRESHFILLLASHSPLAHQDLHVLLLPPSQIALFEFLGSGDRPGWHKRMMRLTMGFIFACILGPVVFIVYAFIRCFAQHGILDVLTWVSLSATMVGLTVAAHTLALMSRWDLVPGRGFRREGVRQILDLLVKEGGTPNPEMLTALMKCTLEQRAMIAQIAADPADPLRVQAGLALTFTSALDKPDQRKETQSERQSAPS